MNTIALAVLLCLAQPLSNNSPWFVHGEITVEDNANHQEPNRYLRTGSDAGESNLDASEEQEQQQLDEQTARDLQFSPGFNPTFSRRFNRGYNRGYANGLRTGQGIGFNQAYQRNNVRAQNPNRGGRPQNQNRFVPRNQRTQRTQRPQIVTDARDVGLPNQIGAFYYVGGNYRAQSYFANPIYGNVFADGENFFGPPGIDDLPPDVDVIVIEPRETPAPTGSPTGPTASPTLVPTGTPTLKPTAGPTSPPTFAPTRQPTLPPTRNPTQPPTTKPTPSPTNSPTANPTKKPTEQPTVTP